MLLSVCLDIYIFRPVFVCVIFDMLLRILYNSRGVSVTGLILNIII